MTQGLEEEHKLKEVCKQLQAKADSKLGEIQVRKR